MPFTLVYDTNRRAAIESVIDKDPLAACLPLVAAPSIAAGSIFYGTQSFALALLPSDLSPCSTLYRWFATFRDALVMLDLNELGGRAAPLAVSSPLHVCGPLALFDACPFYPDEVG